MSQVTAANPAIATQESFLKKLGTLGLDCFTKVLPFVTKQAQSAEPLVDLLFPMQGGIYTAVVNTVCMAELSATEAAATAGTGVQKMQAVLDVVGPLLLERANQQGLIGPAADAAIQRYVQAIFDLLDGPARAASTSAASPATT